MGKPADMVVFRNITERKKAEKRIREYAQELAVRYEQLKVETEKAKESDRLKSEFLANMSHEIRTPLTAIKGAAYLLDKGSLSEEQKKLCSIIGQSGEQLLQIINNILDLALVEAGEVRLEEKEFSLKETLKRIISGLKLQAKEKGLELKMILAPDLPSKILSDEGKLIQILSNLINNALKFTERGKVELRVKRLAHSKIQILVKDTGVGILKEKLSMIFNKFEQVNGTIRRKYGGTGLGLTIVKELVKILGGKIEVTSELGKGSTFSFSFAYRLLKQREVSDKDQAKLKPKIKKKTKKDINILIAEDDDFGYYIIERSLEDYTITRVIDGKDALEKIKKKSYDLVLMDIQMPKMDGLEATRKIREKDFHLPIIALTAKAMKGDEEMCLETGCTDYISKPVAPDELIAKVNQYTTARLVRELESFPARVLDMEALLKTSGQDTNLAQETLKMFLEYLPQQLFKIKKSITDKNPEELERFSHSLKGAAKSVGASIIAELAFSLEKMAGSSSMDEAKATFSRLEKEKERFAEAAKKMPTVSPQPSANFF